MYGRGSEQPRWTPTYTSSQARDAHLPRDDATTVLTLPYHRSPGFVQPINIHGTPATCQAFGWAAAGGTEVSGSTDRGHASPGLAALQG